MIIPSRVSNETCCRVSVTRTYIHVYMYSLITSSFFQGNYIRIQNAFTTQPKLHDACDTVCQCFVYKIVLVDTV